MMLDQMALHFANAAIGGFAFGWVTCLRDIILVKPDLGA